jgi:multidrug resistance efflux pump
MEKFNSYTIRSYDFAKWFFRIVLLIVITFAGLLFFLQINDTVRILQGEIISTNPQSDYKAPYESQLVKINVKEGQHVSRGDTLLVIQNTEYANQHTQKSSEIEYLQKSIDIITSQEQDLQRKKTALMEEAMLNARKNELEVGRINNSIKSLNDQLSLQRERMISANEKFTADSILFRKDMLSKAEFNTSKDERLSVRSAISSIENEKRKNLNDKSLLVNVYSREQNSFSVRKVEMDEQEQLLQQSKNQLSNQLIQGRASVQQTETDLSKQNVIAENDGIVNFLFNTTKTSNLLAKGDLLVSVAPENLDYYAKATISQRDIPYVKAGLQARLKLDAYYHFEHGILKGKVSYLAERKENEKFYALIQLPLSKNYELKPGYTIRGEIVVQRMPLYKYLVKKLFKRFDQS